MRYPFQVIKEWQIPLTPLPKTYPATAAFLELMVTLDELFDEFPAVLRLPEGTRFQVLAPVVRGRKGTQQKEFEAARRSGFARVRVDGNMYELDEEKLNALL